MKPKFWLVLMGLVIGFYSCDTSNGVLPPIQITGLTLDKTTLSLVEGTQGQLVATIAPADAEPQTIKWVTSDAAVATVSATGEVSALKAGTANVTASVGGFLATCAVTVTAQKVAVTGVALGKTTLSLETGKTETLVATVAPATATDPSVAWGSSDPAVATVSQEGVVTAVAFGTATITVTTTDGAKTATCAVTVPKPQTVVSLNKTSLVLPFSNKETLVATVVSVETAPVVTWSSSDPLVATVSSTGEVSALKVGRTTITATCDGQSTECAVAVDPWVYVAGTKSVLDQTPQAVVWTNGVEQVWSDPTKRADAQSISILGNDVYVAGNEADAGKVWKNGQLLYTLTKNNATTEAQSIFVTADGVYTAGVENNVSGHSYVWVWVDQNSPYLLTTFGTAKPYSIYKSGDDFYVVGDTDPGVAPEAVLWKNMAGQGWFTVALPSGGHWSRARSVVVSGGDVYVGGQWRDGSVNPEVIQGVVWKNEVLLYDLSTPGSQSDVNAVAVVGSDVYAVGYGDANPLTGVTVAKVWKNGQLLYNLPSAANYVEATGIAIAQNGTIYVVGSEGFHTPDRVTKVWRNGALLYTLSNGATGVSASAIALREQ